MHNFFKKTLIMLGLSATLFAGTENMKQGVYTADSEGYKGNIKVEVTVDEKKIKDIKIISHEETLGVADGAINQLPKEIVKEQSIAVDTVAGATYSSYAILEAVEGALVMAGANIDNFNKPVIKEIKEGKTEEADIVIIGGGGAGLSAAIETAPKAKVILLEKQAIVGGSTAASSGYFWSVDSSYNKKYNKGLNKEEMLQMLKERTQGNYNLELVERIIDVSGKTFDSLVADGLNMKTDMFPVASPAYPKMDLFVAEGLGAGLIRDMEKIALNKKADIRVNSTVTGLIVDKGVVKGVTVETPEKKYSILAKKVIIASGGFTRSVDMLKEQTPDNADNVPFTGAGGTGDAIRFTKELNPEMVGNGVVGIWGINDKYGFKGDVGQLVRQTNFYVNKDGKRFVDETKYYSDVVFEINKQKDKLVYGLFDSTFKDVANCEKGVKRRVVKKGDTLEELARKMGVPEKEFVKTINENPNLMPMKTAPFYAVEIRPTMIGSINGFKVNSNGEILNKEGKVIPNLYAAGEVAFGNVMYDRYPASGTAVAAAIYMGKIAGEEALKSIGK